MSAAQCDAPQRTVSNAEGSVRRRPPAPRRTRRVVVALPELAGTRDRTCAPARLGPHEALALAGGGNRGDSRGVARQRTPRVGTAETRSREIAVVEKVLVADSAAAREVARVRALRSIRVERSRNTFHTEHGGVERAEIEAGGGPQRDVRARREMKNFSAVGLLAERDARDDAIRAGVRVYASLGDALDDPTLPEQFADARHHAELACAAAEQNLFQHLGRQDPQRADSRRAGTRRIASSSFVFFGAHRLRRAVYAFFARIEPAGGRLSLRQPARALGNSRERDLAFALRVRQGADADVQAPGGGVFGTRRGVVGSFSCDFFFF